MKTLQYKINKIENNIRYITVFTKNKVFAELECFGNFFTDEEEIQFWLDENGYGDECFEFQKID